jgi:hypothetical protein
MKEINIPVLLIRAIAGGIVYIYGFTAFIVHFNFFIKRKQKILAEKDQKLTKFNYFMIFWTVLMWLAKLFNAVSSCVILTMERIQNPPKGSPLKNLLLISGRHYACVLDCLNMLTLIYLFYC